MLIAIILELIERYGNDRADDILAGVMIKHQGYASTLVVLADILNKGE